MPAIPRMRLWLSWTVLTQTPKRLTLEDYRHVIELFQRSRILIACARLSAVFRFGPDAVTAAEKTVTAEWIPKLFPPSFVAAVQQYAAGDWVIFFQGQLRYLAAEALRSKTTIQEGDPQPMPNNVLGQMLLGSAELLYKPHVQMTESLEVMVTFAGEFLPTYEINTPNDAFMLFIRFYIYLTVIIPRLPRHLKTFDVWKEFEDVFGFPLQRYYLFINAIVMHALMDRSEKPPGAPLGGSLSKQWFSNTNLTDAQVEQLFDTVSFRLSNLPDTQPAHGYADFEFLRDNPYLRYVDELFCLDYEYAVSKLESGVIWRVRSGMAESRREPYFSFWGNVFEDYVAWVFEEYANKAKNLFTRDTRLRDGTDDPLCDAFVVCGRTAVLIEVKLATCRADVRYTGDYAAFKKYFDNKLVTGTSRKAGVSQLARAAERVATLRPDVLPECLRGITKFIPLIITRDDVGSSFMTNTYLNARFQQMLSKDWRKQLTITPLVSMSVATLERVIWAIRTMAFSDVLEDRMKRDKKLANPFEAASKYAHKATPRMVDRHIEMMQQVSEEMIASFQIKDGF